LAGIRRTLELVVASVALLAAPGTAGAAIVTNGDFETGTLSGWRDDYVQMPGPSAWFVYTGTTSPLSGAPIPAPPQGSRAAIADQQNISRQILYQDMTVPPGGSLNQLDLTAYYRNNAGLFGSPDSLSVTPGNQQYRIDVMKPSASIDSVASGDVLLNVLRTRTGDPNILAPTQFTADLSPFAGQTVRLRFAVVATTSQLNGGIDAVSVRSNGFTIGRAVRNKKKGTARVPVTVPDPGTLTLTGKGVRRRSAPASKSVAVGAGKVDLVVKATGKKQRKLNDKGKAKVKTTITYTPTGLSPSTQQTKLKLKKKT
jgi:hypothetical protein